MEHIPMPTLQRSVAIYPPQKASITELEQLVKDYRKEKNYLVAEQVLDKIDGLKPHRKSLVVFVNKIPEPTICSTEDDLIYIREYGIEQFIQCKGNYDLKILRLERYLKAQLEFLEYNLDI